MRKLQAISMLTGVSVMLGACNNPSKSSYVLTFPIMNAQNMETGALALTPLKEGGIGVKVTVEGLTPGTHAMHFHETGRCDAPDFKSSGGHFNPTDVAHGKVADGPHAGDMMNIEVGADGSGTFEIKNKKATLVSGGTAGLIDADGAALIIHANADDYTSQPSGAAGPRVACAIIAGG